MNRDFAKRSTHDNMKPASIIFKSLFIISCFYGLMLTYESSSSFKIYISYFTTQSNVLCLVVMIVFLIWKISGKNKNPRFFRVLKSMTTVSILVTFIIYHFLLLPNMEPGMTNVAGGLGNIIVHYVTPIWFFADYMIFETKGYNRMSDLVYYAVFPMYYFVFSNFRAIDGELYQYGNTISEFPYPFLDYEVFGIYGVSAAVLLITVAVLILGFVFIQIDHIMKKPPERYRVHSYGSISYKPIEMTNDDLSDSYQPTLESVAVTNVDEQKEKSNHKFE